MENILMVEPDYRSTYPPLGLMRISTYHKDKGDKVKLLYIKQMPPRLPPTPELCFFNNHE